MLCCRWHVRVDKCLESIGGDGKQRIDTEIFLREVERNLFFFFFFLFLSSLLPPSPSPSPIRSTGWYVQGMTGVVNSSEGQEAAAAGESSVVWRQKRRQRGG